MKAKIDLSWLLNEIEQAEKKNGFYNTSLTQKLNESRLLTLKSVLEVCKEEDNNDSWIRIEEDGSNLPKERCIVWIKEKTTGLIDYCKFESSFFTPLHKSCTHYQPINKPNPPID